MRAPMLPVITGPRTHLPSTRFARERRGWRGWSVAVAIALAVNLGVITLLSAIGRNLPSDGEAPQTVRHIVQAEPPSPPPLAADEPEETPAEAIPQMTLPALDLASPALPTTEFALPATTGLFDPGSLPMSVPAFTVPGLPAAAPAAHDGMVFGEVDEPATLDSTFDLERFYPIDARAHGIEGRSTIAIDIDDEGRVVNVVVNDSTPPGVFESAADRLARTLHFRPARRGSRAVAFQYTTTIAWTMRK
jgi:protein TonB